MKKTRPPLYGVMAEFTDAERLLEAARLAYEQGFRHLDAYSPVPVEGLAEAIGFTPGWEVEAGLIRFVAWLRDHREQG